MNEATDEREILVKGSVVDVRAGFATDLIAENAAELAPTADLITVPLD